MEGQGEGGRGREREGEGEGGGGGGVTSVESVLQRVKEEVTPHLTTLSPSWWRRTCPQDQNLPLPTSPHTRGSCCQQLTSLTCTD